MAIFLSIMGAIIILLSFAGLLFAIGNMWIEFKTRYDREMKKPETE